MSDKEQKLITLLREVLNTNFHILEHCVIQGTDTNDKYHINKINDEWCVYSVVDNIRIDFIALSSCFSACVLYIASVVIDSKLCQTLQNRFIELAAAI